MRIVDVRSWEESVPLTRPYAIASLRIDAVDLFFVRIVADDGLAGVGSASPGEDVTGESPEACREALSKGALAWLRGRDPRHLGAICQHLEQHHRSTPAARAAVEVAMEAVQVYGGNGYTSEYPVEQLARDAKVLQIYGGTDEIQISAIARDLLAR